MFVWTWPVHVLTSTLLVSATEVIIQFLLFFYALFLSCFLFLILVLLDVYAHNVLVTQEGNAKLCDFGASFFYSPSSPFGFEKIEVQAYGLLVHDLASRVADEKEEKGEKRQSVKEKLEEVSTLCLLPVAHERPSFNEIIDLLTVLKHK